MNIKIFSNPSSAISAIFLSFGVASADTFLGLSADYLGNMGYGETYRLYVDLENGARLDAVYGNPASPLTISAKQGSFYQNMFGGDTSLSIYSELFPTLPSAEWDSYVTIGALNQSGYPFDENKLLDIGVDYTSFGSGGAIVTNNGSWFVTPDDVQGEELLERVLIAQLTVIGGTGVGVKDLIVTVNLQGSDVNGNTWQDFGVGLPAPGAIALLGFAGFCMTKRRR